MSPSLDDMELTAAPYLGKGPGEEGADVNRRCDHGYNEAFAFCGGGPLRKGKSLDCCGGCCGGDCICGICCGGSWPRRPAYLSVSGLGVASSKEFKLPVGVDRVCELFSSLTMRPAGPGIWGADPGGPSRLCTVLSWFFLDLNKKAMASQRPDSVRKDRK